MQNINHQIQRIAERYKTYENNNELKEDILALLTQLKEGEDKTIIEPLTIGELVSHRLVQLQDVSQMEKLLVKTGFEDYDDEFGGLLKGEVVVVGARPGMGKTQFIVDMCIKVASEGRSCGFISLELSPYLLANRFIGNISKLSSQSLIKGNFNELETLDLNKASSKLNKLPIFVHDQYIISIFSILDRCRQLVAEKNVEVIFIDYLQLIGNNSKRYNRETELANITRELKKLTKELNISLVITSQLSRQVENRPGGCKRPQLSDLRESGAIEQDADRVLFLYRQEYYGLEVDENNEPTKGVMEIIIAKNNTGNCGSFKLMAEKNFTGFKKYKGPYSELTISQNRLNDLN